jgi:multiple sugar transport system permease protein
MAPLAWWFLTSIRPMSARFSIAGDVFFDFTPTFANYAVALFGGDLSLANLFRLGSDNTFDSRLPLVSSVVIAVGATVLTLALSTPAAYALSRLAFPGRRAALGALLVQRMLPPIAIIIPAVYLIRDLDLYDTHAAVMLLHGLMNIPIAVLLMKSFFDDIPREIDDAATIDGASRAQAFLRVLLPMMKGGLAATAVLCFTFSWTEFLLSLFLTTSVRTLPVKIATFGSSIGQLGGVVAALGTSAMVPGFVFILLVQRHLVRGLSLGAMKD